MATDNGTQKILSSKQEILDYAKISKNLYAKLVKMGMPVLYLDGRCLAHKDNIDDFIKSITRVNSSKVPDTIIEGDDEK